MFKRPAHKYKECVAVRSYSKLPWNLNKEQCTPQPDGSQPGYLDSPDYHKRDVHDGTHHEPISLPLDAYPWR